MSPEATPVTGTTALMPHGADVRIGVLTSGGDAQGMNAAVRAVVRTSLALGARPFAVLEGWAGAVKGGDAVKEMEWSDASGILSEGGTIIGTARCPEFRDYSGRHAAALHLLEHGIDRLVVIGGDGSLSGTEEFRSEWTRHLGELVQEGAIDQATADAHPALLVVGLLGSIDNDMVGSDMTIGADTALHRIIDAMDQLSSTAASHQRTFVVEVMGRHCGYLPLMAAVAGGADYVVTPENPVGPGWEEDMCRKLHAGREAGRRDSIILVAEGAADQSGERVGPERIAGVLKERLGEDARITILGHVQRGGSPSAYDRWMSTLLGYAAVQEILTLTGTDEPFILGIQHNRVTKLPLMKAVHDTRAVKDLIAKGDYTSAQRARGSSFTSMMAINEILSTPPQLTALDPKAPARRIGILHAGGLAPGMNTAARAAVRMGIARGWTMLGIDGSWAGLAADKVRELSWSDVEGWAFHGGAELGTRRPVPGVEEYYSLGRAIERNEIDALLVIGGLNAYLAVSEMNRERDRYPAFRIPVVLVPASIDNNLPGTEFSIGADTALNNAVWALDRIKESAAASTRCFVAEIMGRTCGYLTLMSGIASGAEYAYLNEEPYTLTQIDRDAQRLRRTFEAGRRLFLVVVNEESSKYYNREFLASVFEAESGGLYDVRNAALGHLQQGGEPSAYDRLLATRLVHHALGVLADQFDASSRDAVYIGMMGNAIETRAAEQMGEDFDERARRPHDQWWLSLRPVLSAVSMKDSGATLTRVPIGSALDAPR